jgi:hypothetical protein
MIDRRLIPRWEVNSPIAVRLKDGNAVEACRLEDMNLKGMRISLADQLPEKRDLRLEVSLMNGFHMDVMASVRWREQSAGRYVYGLAFDGIRDTDRDGIYQYLHDRIGSKWEEHWWSVKEY